MPVIDRHSFTENVVTISLNRQAWLSVFIGTSGFHPNAARASAGSSLGRKCPKLAVVCRQREKAFYFESC